MADIELVIKIPEGIYKASQIIDVKYEDVIQIPLEVIAHSIPLPKGHGRIIDENKISSFRWDKLDNHAVVTAPTIIEADKEQEEL